MAGSRAAAFKRSPEGEQARRATIKARLLAILSDKKEHWGNDIDQALGRRFGGRLKDLRDEGHLIASWPVGDDWKYQLHWRADEVTPARYAVFADRYPECLPKRKGDAERDRLKARIAELERICRSREVALAAVLDCGLGAPRGSLVSQKALDELHRIGATVRVERDGDYVLFSAVIPEEWS